MKIKLKEMLNKDGLDINDYRGALGEIDVPDEEAKHLIDIKRAVEVKAAKSKKKKKG